MTSPHSPWSPPPRPVPPPETIEIDRSIDRMDSADRPIDRLADATVTTRRRQSHVHVRKLLFRTHALSYTGHLAHAHTHSMSAQLGFATATRAAPVVAKKPTTARRATRARVVTRAARDGPVIIGLAADSGCGKSTFMRRMTSLFGGKATPPEGGNPDSNTLISDTTTVLCLDDYHLNDRQGRKESGLTALNLKEQNFGASCDARVRGARMDETAVARARRGTRDAGRYPRGTTRMNE